MSSVSPKKKKKNSNHVTVHILESKPFIPTVHVDLLRWDRAWYANAHTLAPRRRRRPCRPASGVAYGPTASQPVGPRRDVFRAGCAGHDRCRLLEHAGDGWRPLSLRPPPSKCHLNKNGKLKTAPAAHASPVASPRVHTRDGPPPSVIRSRHPARVALSSCRAPAADRGARTVQRVPHAPAPAAVIAHGATLPLLRPPRGPSAASGATHSVPPLRPSARGPARNAIRIASCAHSAYDDITHCTPPHARTHDVPYNSINNNSMTVVGRSIPAAESARRIIYYIIVVVMI